jgi:hypothetical protein
MGLAASACGLDALLAPTARALEQPSGLPGDNVVIFGRQGQQIPFLWIEEVLAFPLTGPIERYELT